MKKQEMLTLWLQEEAHAFQGWDFSYIKDRYQEEPLPWSYTDIVKALMKGKVLLDMGTGGGELLLSLQPEAGMTYATESYPPNIELCKAALPKHGIEIRGIEDDEALPFEDNFFDLVINRHESFSPREVHRILKPHGIFITQQVGGTNDKELSKSILGHYPDIVSFDFNLNGTAAMLRESGFKLLRQYEAFPCARFYDIGALVYYAKILPWEFPDFSVEHCFDKLWALQERLEATGFVESQEHRFFIEAVKEA